MNPTPQLGDRHAEEISRIRTEYERRSRDIPEGYYDLRHPVNQFFHQQTVRACLGMLAAAGAMPLDGKRIADVGCGSGSWLLEFLQWGARVEDVAGVDLDSEKIRKAKLRLPGVSLTVGDACSLPWPGNSLDLVSQFTVFTSILDAGVKRSLAAEMIRVLKPGGYVLWYDFRVNNPRNPNVRRVSAPELRTLFPGCAISLRSVTLAPPLARTLVPISWISALMLEKIPLLRTHYAALIQKPA